MAIELVSGMWISSSKDSFILERAVKVRIRKGPKKGEVIETIRSTYYLTMEQCLKAMFTFIIQRHNKMKKRIAWSQIEESKRSIALLNDKYGDAMTLLRIVKKIGKQLKEATHGITRKDMIDSVNGFTNAELNEFRKQKAK